MAGGRPRKPTALKLLEGNAGKRTKKEDLDREPQPEELTDLAAPAHLLPEAKKVWDNFAPKLVKVGLLKETDTLEFSMLCQSWALMLDAEKTIKAQGQVCTSKMGGGKYSHPAMHNRSALMKQISSGCGKFGMSASARSGLQMNNLPAASEADTAAGAPYLNYRKATSA